MSSKQSGVALIMVLWIVLLITISTGAYTLMARMDQLEAHTVLWSTQARLAAEAGVNFAVLAIRHPDEQERWLADGRAYELDYHGAMIEVMITDERGKVDVNSADEQTLTQLFYANGMDELDAMDLAAAVLDWTDGDEMARPGGAEEGEYTSAGYEVGPANRDFIMTAELLQVLGLSWELYKKMEPGLTVWSSCGHPVVLRKWYG